MRSGHRWGEDTPQKTRRSPVLSRGKTVSEEYLFFAVGFLNQLGEVGKVPGLAPRCCAAFCWVGPFLRTRVRGGAGEGGLPSPTSQFRHSPCADLAHVGISSLFGGDAPRVALARAAKRSLPQPRVGDSAEFQQMLMHLRNPQNYLKYSV